MNTVWKWSALFAVAFLIIALLVLPWGGGLRFMPMMRYPGGMWGWGGMSWMAGGMLLLPLAWIGLFVVAVVMLIRSGSSAATMTCPHCSKPAQTGWVVCPHCGGKLG